MTPAPLKIDTRITLNNNTKIPLFGLGVYLSSEGQQCKNAINSALDAGYRLIDTASFYDNEESVGEVIRESNIPRAEIFVTSKLWNSDHGYDNTLRAFDKSMDRLGLDYMDLYLVHYPVAGIRQETWKAMEKIAASGKCKAIGVSNYLTNHLQELLSNCNIPPAVNQIEMSPFCYRSRIDTVNLCRENNILVQAYSPLVRMRRNEHPGLVKLANTHGKTVPQILIRWALQHGIPAIPKSSNPSRILQNADVFDFELSDEDMEILDGFDEGFIVCWDPSVTR